MSFLPLVRPHLRANTSAMATIIPTIHAGHPTGLLDLPQRMRMTAALLAARWWRRRRATGQGVRGGLHTELDKPALWRAIEAPKGRLAQRAWALAQEHQPPWMVNHGLRSYAWGQALGVIGGLSPDREALFAAAMLHDAGLTPVAATPPQSCFAIRGARHARHALEGATDLRTLEVVVQAIARHLDLHVDVGDGVEAHLMQAGAMADVLGHRVDRVPHDVREQVLGAHPRLGMKEELCRCMSRETAAAPHSRVGCYVRHIDFLNLIRQAPFEE